MNINRYLIYIILTIISFVTLASFRNVNDDIVEAGLWGFIDSTLLVFFVIALPFFVLLLANRISGKFYRKLIQKNYISHLTTTELALLVVTNPLFIVLWLHDKGTKFLRRISYNRYISYSIIFIGLSMLVFLISNNHFVAWKPFSFKAMLIRNVILIFPIAIIFRDLIQVGFFKKFHFWKGEFLKFAILIFGTLAFHLIGNEIAFLIDKVQFSGLTRTPFINAPDSVLFGLFFSFVIANLLNNITLKIIRNDRKTKRNTNDTILPNYVATHS